MQVIRCSCAHVRTQFLGPFVLPQLERVLGVFQKILSVRSTDAHACRLLTALWTVYEAAEIQQFIPTVFNLCLQRLQSNKKIGPALIANWSFFVARYGAALRGLT